LFDLVDLGHPAYFYSHKLLTIDGR
jgi:hypothetical protein